MAAVQLAMNDWNGMLETLEMSLRLEPDSDSGHHLRALAHLQLGHFSSAEQSVRTAISLEPSWARYRTTYARILAACYFFADALEQAVEALRLDPDDGDAHALRGHLLALVPRRDMTLSKESARRAVELDPYDASAHATLGFAYLMSKEPDAAIQQCRTALEIDPTDELALRVLVEATAASSILNRPMFSFGLWLDRLGQGGTFAFIFGLWALVNAISGLLRDTPYAGYGSLVTTIYIAFCLYTWFARPVTMFLLRRKHSWLRDIDV